MDEQENKSQEKKSENESLDSRRSFVLPFDATFPSALSSVVSVRLAVLSLLLASFVVKSHPRTSRFLPLISLSFRRPSRTATANLLRLAAVDSGPS
jgi:hypothetical protein